jgi:hypothetical protein
MKKVLIIIAITFSLNIVANAQEYKTSLGLRVGQPYGLSIKHFLSEKNAIEGIMGSSISWGGFTITGLYEFEKWTGEYPGLNWFWGFGAHVGFWDAGTNPHVDNTYSGSVLGVDGIVGLEYTFDEIPLNLAVDLMPTLNLFGSTGWGGINGAVTVRYVF